MGCALRGRARANDAAGSWAVLLSTRGAVALNRLMKFYIADDPGILPT
jgi:hypothetical protein